MLPILLAGFYMMAAAQISAAWLIVAFLTLIFLAIVATVLTGRNMNRIRAAVTNEIGRASAPINVLLNNPLLSTAIHLRVSLALGIVFLMTVKPDWGGALLTISIAAFVGLVSGLPQLKRKRVTEKKANVTS